MSGAFAADCPVCSRTVVVTGYVASCGDCAVVAGVADARDWDNMEELDA